MVFKHDSNCEYFALTMAGIFLLLNGCSGFDFTQKQYFCDNTHRCAVGWTCEKSVCVPERDVVVDVKDGQETVTDTGPCVADCKGRECGDDGCGGTCGSCGEHQACSDGHCVDQEFCGDRLCNHNETCGTCAYDCGCPVGETCNKDHCCVPGAAGCVKTSGEDWDGDGVPNQWEMDHCKNTKCRDYATRHSEVFPDGFTLANGNKVVHPTAEPCCPLALKGSNDQDVPCSCDLNCDGKVKWCAPLDRDGDGYTPAQGDCNDNDPNIHPGAPEKCGDGIDQDCKDGDLSCKGLTDADKDGWPAIFDCNDNNPNIHPNAPEKCDGKDDNCNGYIDDGDPQALDQACHDWKGQVYKDGPTCKPGTMVCLHVPGKQTKPACMGEVGPQTEVCNHLDDDCNGNTDEGFDLKTDKKNCGDCGIACQNANGTTTCASGKCVPVCKKGYGDCDWNPNNGCEAKLTDVSQCGSCDQETPCPLGFFCNKGICSRKYPLGHACDGQEQCQEGTDELPHCTDESRCCDQACDGPCRTCVDGLCKNQKRTPEKPGDCNGGLCGPDGKCMDGCKNDGDCQTKAGYICAGTTDKKLCILPLKLGEDCTTLGALACSTGFCRDGRCCDSSCDGKCMRCDEPGYSGHCRPVKIGPDPDTCTNGMTCDANGNCKIMDGQSCTASTECISGVCKPDWDKNGYFCAASLACVHNGNVYNNNDMAGCIDARYAHLCDGGNWTSFDCKTDSCDLENDPKKGRHYYFHERGCEVNNGVTQCFDRPKDPDLKKDFCTTCFDATHWIGHECCGDDPGEYITSAGTGGSCCYNSTVITSGLAVENNILCYDGLLYACGNKPAACTKCMQAAPCDIYGTKQCCNNQWQDNCAAQCQHSDTDGTDD